MPYNPLISNANTPSNNRMIPTHTNKDKPHRNHHSPILEESLMKDFIAKDIDDKIRKAEGLATVRNKD